MQTLEQAGNIEGKRVLLVVDLNAPVLDGKVADTFRIEKAVETIDLLRAKKAKTIIISHADNKEGHSLWPAYQCLAGFVPVKFSKDFFTPEALALVDELKDGEVLLFENVRNNPGEEENNPEFAEKLAKYADLYVNDCFSVSHRKHASIIGLPKFLPHYAGPILMSEIENLSKAFNPPHPFLFILGGAKFETKVPLVEKFLSLADQVFIGGALAKNAYEKYKDNPKVSFPEGDIAALDSNQETLAKLAPIIKEAKFVLWNGPLGDYENNYKEGTFKLAQLLADSDAEVVVGGGDTVTLIQEAGLLDKFSFVSTAGGAMLDFLANGTLPGIEALSS